MGKWDGRIPPTGAARTRASFSCLFPRTGAAARVWLNEVRLRCARGKTCICASTSSTEMLIASTGDLLDPWTF